MTIGILNYGMGNVGSIANMFKKVGARTRLISTADALTDIQALVLPGVGKFDNALQRLRDHNFIEPLNYIAHNEKLPILGICIGMQIMTNRSDEGNFQGLGWIDAETVHLGLDSKKLRIPHMGWNVAHIEKNSPLFDTRDQNEQRFYFVHSYAVKCNNIDNVLTTSFYGSKFVSAFSQDNIIGVQFHPEKSHKFGMSLFRKFSELSGEI